MMSVSVESCVIALVWFVVGVVVVVVDVVTVVVAVEVARAST